MEANRPDTVVIQSRSPLFHIITKEDKDDDEKQSEIKALPEHRNRKSLEGARRN